GRAPIAHAAQEAPLGVELADRRWTGPGDPDVTTGIDGERPWIGKLSRARPAPVVKDCGAPERIDTEQHRARTIEDDELVGGKHGGAGDVGHVYPRGIWRNRCHRG